MNFHFNPSCKTPSEAEEITWSPVVAPQFLPLSISGSHDPAHQNTVPLEVQLLSKVF